MMARPAKKPLGLYVHIPFCRQKCSYCDFYSLPHSEEKMDAYTAALVRHLEEVAPQAAAHQADTVYIGGGTPTWARPVSRPSSRPFASGTMSAATRRSPWRPTRTPPVT